MSKKIDPRLPDDFGKGIMKERPTIKSPWGRLVGFQEANHYASRYEAVISAAVMQAFRILVPDYKTRAQTMCTEAYGRLYYIQMQYGDVLSDNHNVHPFCRGNFAGALTGDSGDEELMMCGRVQDFGTYRAEKELDVCDWDIVGSDLCRATTQSFEASADAWAAKRRPGPKLEYHMVEARGCGDMHCRVVAESRDKYPMPPHEQWECFGPVATMDQIKYTPREEMVTESQAFREECDYRYASGTNYERDGAGAISVMCSAASNYLLPGIDMMIREGQLNEETVDHVLHCVLEAAGKAAMGEKSAVEAQRQWLGAPAGLCDGRLMGGHIEMFLQSLRIPYEVEEFNEEQCIYLIDRAALNQLTRKLVAIHLSYWYGMVKTLVSAEWSVWEDALEDTPAEKVRVRIARKIDKFC